MKKYIALLLIIFICLIAYQSQGPKEEIITDIGAYKDFESYISLINETDNCRAEYAGFGGDTTLGPGNSYVIYNPNCKYCSKDSPFIKIRISFDENGEEKDRYISYFAMQIPCDAVSYSYEDDDISAAAECADHILKYILPNLDKSERERVKKLLKLPNSDQIEKYIGEKGVKGFGINNIKIKTADGKSFRLHTESRKNKDIILIMKEE